MKQEKKFYEKWQFWLIILAVIVIIIIGIIITNNQAKGVGSAGISREEYNEIEIGKTTNFELNEIIDKDDEWSNDAIYDKCVQQISEEKEDSKYTYVYKYYGERSGYAIITLQADYSNGYFYNDVIVIKKEKFNLK